LPLGHIYAIVTIEHSSGIAGQGSGWGNGERPASITEVGFFNRERCFAAFDAILDR
jgi:hypothetical protein